jgi:hypothetical protein
VIGLGKRLATLEAKTLVGCGTCRGWWSIVLGDDVGNRSRPERCPDCGRLVPIRLVTVIVGVPLGAV